MFKNLISQQILAVMSIEKQDITKDPHKFPARKTTQVNYNTNIFYYIHITGITTSHTL